MSENNPSAVSNQSSVVESAVSGDWTSDEEDFVDYYDQQDELVEDVAPQDAAFQSDPEHYVYNCLSLEETWNYLDSSAREISRTIKVDVPMARALLHALKWDSRKVLTRYSTDKDNLLTECYLIVPSNPDPVLSSCPICLTSVLETSLNGLSCGHLFCMDCWREYVITRIQNGVSTGMECMQCPMRLTIEVVQSFLLPSTNQLLHKFLQLTLSEFVLSHTLLRWCPGADCSTVFQVEEEQAKKVECSKCTTSCCFKCGDDYHMPTDCDIIKKWMSKCSDDSETANYILANTKDCPKCRAVIEKNGGCNHMSCSRCKFDFCWMCLGPWKSHTGYFECNKYKADKADDQNRARQALEKYLFYYQRWANHNQSLQLEEETKKKIVDRTEEKVSSGCGTWIDWQYLFNAVELLRRCRYTLKYTYPFAYFSDGDRKQLFEYQQAQLEVEIENLSWKLERAETTDVADIHQQMNITEVQRLTLLRDFVP